MTDVPLVSIRCLVYNHEPYLRQCLDGFVMQKTNFPFEAIVHDDASTDGSAAIIREYAEKYPDIIKPVFETENQYSKRDGSLARAMDAAMHPDSKYVALCEGDDYWTDPNKLQMQVDILESDSEVGLVHTSADSFDQNRGLFTALGFGAPIDSFSAELKRNECISHTTCFRKSLFLDYKKYYAQNRLSEKRWKMGDYPMWLYFCYYSKSVFIPKSTGVYRVLKNSASHSTDAQKKVDFEVSAFEIKKFFATHFNHEYLLKELAIDLLKSLTLISIESDRTIKYDVFKQLRDVYGFNWPIVSLLVFIVAKSRVGRIILRKFRQFRLLAKGIH